MSKLRQALRDHRLWFAATIILFSSGALLPFPWNQALDEALLDLRFKIRGPRRCSEKIVFTFLGAEELRALGGWPITRDYYGYLTHALSRSGARVIGLDFLFNSPSQIYPEYDEFLADFFRSAGNVCLPITFSELRSDTNASAGKLGLMYGEDPILPIPPLKHHAAGLGFSNLSEETVVRRAPVAVVHGDSLWLSFGAELARLYYGARRESVVIREGALEMVDQQGHRLRFPLDRSGCLLLNHLGSQSQIAARGFVELLRTFENEADSTALNGKLVLVAVTAPGLASLKATPLAAALPAALIHLTVAENLITQNTLRVLPAFIHVLLTGFLLLPFAILYGRIRTRVFITGVAAMLIAYWIATIVAFEQAHTVLPLLHPTGALFAAILLAVVLRGREWQMGNLALQRALHEQIVSKEEHLERAKSQLAELRRELENSASVSEEIRKLAEDRKNEILTLEKQLSDLQAYFLPPPQAATTNFSQIIHAAGSKMAEVLDTIAKIAQDDIPVLVMGETGTGKELIARAIHQAGARRQSPFVAVNCSALPETLLESELFGHEKGSFTGATARRRGRFELANGGIVFLDEITETTPTFQAKLLRVLQDGGFERLGGEETIKVNVRVIAASNKVVQMEVEKGTFRPDLFYRLNGFPISLPPLRERREDIPMLAGHFLAKHGHVAVTGISERAMEAMQNYRWPGNVRELENVIRRAAILAQSSGRSVIQLGDLPREIAEGEALAQPPVVFQPLDEQILTMLRTLRFSRSSINQTAKALGNRDRGTITEYFRGMCFESLVRCEFEVERAAQEIAATKDAEVIARVEAKIKGYLKNLEKDASALALKPKGQAEATPASLKGLPQKYHPCLKEVMAHFVEQ